MSDPQAIWQGNFPRKDIGEDHIVIENGHQGIPSPHANIAQCN